MEKRVAALDEGALCCGWNYCGRRIAVGFDDGRIAVHDSAEPGSTTSFTRTNQWPAHGAKIRNVIWAPPVYGDVIASICLDGTISLWEETQEDTENPIWKLCKLFEGEKSKVLDIQFGVCTTSLKLVAACSDGTVKIYELLDPLELKTWQLQAEFQNVTDSASRFEKPTCISASVAWSPRRGDEHLSIFVVGFSADSPQINSPKIWEFDEIHQRWLAIAELALPEDQGDRVHAVAWAPNIGRPYDLIAVATCKGIAIWHLGLTPDTGGRLSTEKVALLSGHDGEVWQLEWDMSGMTLASTGGDGAVRLWQSNLNGVWHEQAVFHCGETPEQ
ncbi:transducin/WD40 repeat-like superfamily protein [Wolffia australiana]